VSIRPFHHQRPLVAVALAYGAGVWAGVRFAFLPCVFSCGLLVSVLIAFLMYKLGRKWIAGAMAAALFLGMLLSGCAFHPSLPPEGNYRVEGIVAEDMVLREDGKAAGYLENVSLTGESGVHTLSKVYWTYYYDEEAPFLPRDGQQVQFSSLLYHPKGQTNPYGFDFRLFLLQKGAIAGVSGAREPEIVASPGRGMDSFFYQVKIYLRERLRAIFGEGSALPEALLLGDRSNLPQDMQDSFASAGVAHVLAVSGLHIGLLAGVLQWIIRHWMNPRRRILVLGIFLFCYCALLNFAAPVVRAAILVMLGGMRKIIRRSRDDLTTLSAAFLILLFFRPLDLFSASFQLSFGAVLGIVLFKPSIMKAMDFIRIPFPKDGVSVTLSATAGAALPTVQVFHRFSMLGIVINPLICGIFAVLLPVYAAVLIIGCIWLPLGQAIAIPVIWAAGWIARGIEWAGNLPFAAVALPALPWYAVCALIAAALICGRYAVLNARKKALIAAGLVIVSIAFWQGGICRDVQYVQLDMGQADAALILDGSETVLIDTGEYGGDVVSYLKATGRKADHIVITHLHSDHFLGLSQILKARIPIGEVIVPEGAFLQQIDDQALALKTEIESLGIPIREWAAGDALKTDRVSIQATWPYPGTVRSGMDANRYPLVLLCQLDGVRLLSASDIIGEFEGYAAVDADILKVSHHGSKTSSGEDFLSRVSPGAALITADSDSKTLPHPDTLSRLAQSGISVYNTGETGAIHIRIRDGNAILTPYLFQGDEP